MARFAELLLAGQFATGVTYYEDHYPSEQREPRIVLTVRLERRLIVPVIVDTGAPWCILDPQIADRIETSADATYAPSKGLTIRGIEYDGTLHRVCFGLWSEQEGTDLEIEATVFVPRLSPRDTWNYPNFIGLSGFLDRVRFAVDPAENAFHFGPA